MNVSKQEFDEVDCIIQQWQRECPQLDTSAMETIGRLKRCHALLKPKLECVFDDFSLNHWEFDVLATLKRSGAPYCLAPTELFSALMVTSGTMTHRMTGLEKKGWVERTANPEDARSKLVQLTPTGLALITDAVMAHAENEKNILSVLNQQQRDAVDAALKHLLSILED